MAFFNFLQKYYEERKRKEKYLIVLDDAINRLEKGDLSSLKTVYGIFATGDDKRIKRAGACIRNVLQDFSVTRMLKLDEDFRACTSLEWSIDWSKVFPRDLKSSFLDEQDYIYVMILGTFHPSGYYREKCLEELSQSKNSLPYLLLRLNDWVLPVRKKAFSCCMARVSAASFEEILNSCIVLEKLQRSSRYESQDFSIVIRNIAKRLRELIQEVDVKAVVKYDFHVRKAFYKFVITNDLINFEQMSNLLEQEPHGNCKTLLICALLSYKECSMEQVDRYLENKSACVRRKALEYKYEVLHDTWEGLENKLLDESMGIREYAAFILNKHTDLDIGEFYRKHLQDENPKTAISGLADRGGKDDWKLLIPFLDHGAERILRNTITALSRFDAYDGYETFWNYLKDDRVVVVKAAYMAIRRKDYYYGAECVYRSLAESKGGVAEKYYLRLLLKERSWDRLPYLLSLYAQKAFPDEERILLSAINNRYLYEKIPASQIESVKKVLEQYRLLLPQAMVKALEFDLKLMAKE